MQPQLGYLSQQAGGRSNYLTAPTPAAAPNKGSSWLSVLPSALAAGASFIPGVGSVVAGGLGAVGEAARENMAGEKTDFGKIAGEATLSAVPFGLGKATKLAKVGIDAAKGINVTAKGLKVADKVAQATGDVSKVADVAAPVTGDIAAGTNPNLLQRMSANIQQGMTGIKPGASAVGQSKLGVNDANELNNFLTNDAKITSGTPAKQLAQLEERHAVWGKQIGDTVAANNKPLIASDLSAVKDQVDSRLAQIPGIPRVAGETALVGADGKALISTGGDAIDHQYVNDLYKSLGQVKDLKGLQELKQSIDEAAINYGRSSNNPEPMKEQIAKAFRAGIADHIGNAIPDLQPLNNLYGKSADAQDFLKSAAGKTPPGGISLAGPFGGPKFGGQAIQTATAKVGQVAGQVGDALAGAPAVDAAGNVVASAPSLVGRIVQGGKNAGKYAGAVGAQELTRAAANGAQAIVDPATVTAPPPTSPAAVASSPTGAATLPVPTTGSPNGIDVDAMLEEALSSPDAKTQSAKLALIKQVLDIQNATASKAPKAVSAANNELIGNTQSGLDAIKTIRSEVAKNSNVATINKGASLLGNIGRGVAGTQQFDAAVTELSDVLARMRSGAALSAADEARYKRDLPTAFDSPALIAQKLDRYQTEFQGIANRAQAGSPALETAGVTQN